MKIPASGDIPPSLLVSVNREFSEAPAGEGTVQSSGKLRRSKKPSNKDGYSWEQIPQSSRVTQGEKRKMQVMLFAGGLLFVVIIGGVLMSILTGPPPVISDGGKPVDKIITTVEVTPSAQRSAASILMDVKPLVKKFLEARTVDEALEFVRNPGVAESRMREFYPDGKIEPVGLTTLNADSGMTMKGKRLSVAVMTRNQGERFLGLVETSQGLKIDWESWAGWLELPWNKFLSSKPSTSHIFRVTLSAVDYYNFGFSDESKWQSYRLESPDREHGIYGYVERGSELDTQLRLNVDENDIMLTLALKFPLDSQSSSQVEIGRLVCEGWVEEGESP